MFTNVFYFVSFFFEYMTYCFIFIQRIHQLLMITGVAWRKIDKNQYFEKSFTYLRFGDDDDGNDPQIQNATKAIADCNRLLHTTFESFEKVETSQQSKLTVDRRRPGGCCCPREALPRSYLHPLPLSLFPHHLHHHHLHQRCARVLLWEAESRVGGR